MEDIYFNLKHPAGYLESCQRMWWSLSAKNVQGSYSLTIFPKTLHHLCLTGSKYVFGVQDLAICLVYTENPSIIHIEKKNIS